MSTEKRFEVALEGFTVERDERGQWTTTCHKCGVQMGSFTATTVQPFIASHRLPTVQNTAEAVGHWGGMRRCVRPDPHDVHNWEDAHNVTFTCDFYGLPAESLFRPV